MNAFTENERKILSFMRELKPFEEIKILKDQNGRIDYYIVTRTQKIVLSRNLHDKENML